MLSKFKDNHNGYKGMRKGDKYGREVSSRFKDGFVSRTHRPGKKTQDSSRQKTAQNDKMQGDMAEIINTVIVKTA
jgi:hypothetical protein